MVKKLVFGLKNWFLRKSTVGYYSSARDWSGTVHRLRQWLGHGPYTARHRSASRLGHGRTRHRGLFTGSGSAREYGSGTARTRGRHGVPRFADGVRGLLGQNGSRPSLARAWPRSSRWFPGIFGSRPGVARWCPAILGQAFRRAPGVLDAGYCSDWVCFSGLGAGFGSRVVGFRVWAPIWAGLLGWIRFSLFLFYFNQINLF